MFNRVFFVSNSQYRAVPKKNRPVSKTIQLNNRIPADEISENAPDYLPPSIYRKLEPMQQKPQEDTIHPLRSPHAENSKEPSAKPKKRHSRPLKLTGEVNLGPNKFTNRDKKQRKKQQLKPVETPAADIEETVKNAGRHHHHKHPNDIPEIESTPYQAPTLVFETTPEPIFERTTSTVEAKKKLDEKAIRRDRLRQKLAALSPEEQQAFLLMKKQRADAKKKGLKFN